MIWLFVYVCGLLFTVAVGRSGLLSLDVCDFPPSWRAQLREANGGEEEFSAFSAASLRGSAAIAGIPQWGIVLSTAVALALWPVMLPFRIALPYAIRWVAGRESRAS
jgi:hypothetical protein